MKKTSKKMKPKNSKLIDLILKDKVKKSKDAHFHFRVDHEEKTQFDKWCASNGKTTTEVFIKFMKQILADSQNKVA